jgi:Lsr2
VDQARPLAEHKIRRHSATSGAVSERVASRARISEMSRVGRAGSRRCALEIDLFEANAKALKALQPYVAAAGKAGGTGRGGRRGRGRGRGRNAEQIKAIRNWAKHQGMDVSERGRIPAKIEEAYQAAH